MADTSTASRPRRSVLYMPAANERALEKAKTIPCDALIFDLEDAVAPDAKDAARAQAVAAAQSGEYGHREITIRCNGLDTPWGAADVAAAAQSGAAAVVIPKVGSVAYVDEISAALDAAGAPAEMKIWAMFETPTAILDARHIAAHPRVEVIVMGTNDLYRELRAQMVTGRGPIRSHLATSILAAREAGKAILDGSTTTSATTRASGSKPSTASRWASTARPSCTRARSNPPTTSGHRLPTRSSTLAR
ncbi:MAG: aldolase/citrate lyase family protein [Acidimicrobiales bacterium]